MASTCSCATQRVLAIRAACSRRSDPKGELQKTLNAPRCAARAPAHSGGQRGGTGRESTSRVQTRVAAPGWLPTPFPGPSLASQNQWAFTIWSHCGDFISAQRSSWGAWPGPPGDGDKMGPGCKPGHAFVQIKLGASRATASLHALAPYCAWPRG